ncbi:MAG: AAA family ATPase [Verrucomicrobiota bacterium]|nr:AAA family ATPase [Verrucomicrobiota bacterium]
MSALNAKHHLLEIELLREKVPSFETYPFSLPVVRNFHSLKPHPGVTFIVGENGSGKSTLLEAIAVAWGFNPEGGTRNFNFSTRASHSPLCECLRLSRGARRAKDGFFLRAESFFNVATEIERLGVTGSYGGVPLHEQSHGEAFLALVMNRFGGDGLYVLDEPEAALSPMRQLTLLARLHQLVGARSQFIIATHSPMLLAYPDADIYQIENGDLRKVAYEETTHYIIAKAFLNNPRRQLERLLDGG